MVQTLSSLILLVTACTVLSRSVPVGWHPFPYPVPSFLQDRVSAVTYQKWLNVKASALRKRDLRLKRPFAAATPRYVYMQKLHAAVIKTGLYDPFSGDTLRWDLIGTWDPHKAKGNSGYKKKFNLMPTADHISPDAQELDFEICSWLSNTAKTFLSPGEFVEMCGKIVAYRSKLAARKLETVPVYALPSYLQGICEPAVYRKWLDTRAEQEYDRDRRLKRPYALRSSKTLYKQAIHDAVNAGNGTDPFTGDWLQWERINSWGNFHPKDIINHEKEYSLLPTVDHVNPDSDTLEFEICSWIVNNSKGRLSSEEYLDYCTRVAAYAGKAGKVLKTNFESELPE
jgi:hypothetical protein